MKQKKKELFSLLFAVVLAAVFLYLAVRGVDWDVVKDMILRARVESLALGCFWATAAIFFRSGRWRILLQASLLLPRTLVFWATSVGYLGNHFLPARVGELMRTAAIGWRGGLSKAYVLATALTERMLDAGILVLISSAALLTMPGLPEWTLRSAQTMALASAVGVAAIFVLPVAEGLIRACINRMPVAEEWHDRCGKLLGHFMLGMKVFHHPGRAWRFLALTAWIWALDGLTALAVSQALDLRLSFAQLLILVAALGLASALPSTPGFVGIYQFVAVTVLGPFGVPKDSSLAFIFLLQGVISGCVLIWGLLGLWQLRSIGALPSRKSKPAADVPDAALSGPIL